MRHLKLLLAALAIASTFTVNAEVVSTMLTRASSVLSEDFNSMWDGSAGTIWTSAGESFYTFYAGGIITRKVVH